MRSSESSVRRENDLVMSRLVPMLWDGVLPSSRDTSRMKVDQEEVRRPKEDDETSRLDEGKERVSRVATSRREEGRKLTSSWVKT